MYTQSTSPSGSVNDAEAARSLGYKAAREQFVEKVNLLLKHAAARQNNGEALFFATGHVNPIETEPRIVLRDLGEHPSQPGVKKTIETLKLGVSLTGDGKSAPLVLQSVYPNMNGGVMTVEIAGASPRLPRDHHDSVQYHPQNAHLANAAVKLRVQTGNKNDMQDSSAEYVVLGDGDIRVARLEHQAADPEGWEERAIQGLHYAQTVVDHVAHDLGLGAKPEYFDIG